MQQSLEFLIETVDVSNAEWRFCDFFSSKYRICEQIKSCVFREWELISYQCWGYPKVVRIGRSARKGHPSPNDHLGGVLHSGLLSHPITVMRHGKIIGPETISWMKFYTSWLQWKFALITTQKRPEVLPQAIKAVYKKCRRESRTVSLFFPNPSQSWIVNYSLEILENIIRFDDNSFDSKHIDVFFSVVGVLNGLKSILRQVFIWWNLMRRTFVVGLRIERFFRIYSQETE